MDKSHMSTHLLQQAYDPEDFRHRGHELIDLLADHLKACRAGTEEKVIRWNGPEDEKTYWEQFLSREDGDSFFGRVLAHTTHVHNPRYIGHQVCAPAPVAALCGMMSSFLNNGMAVYEMGMAPSAMERIVTDLLARKIGFSENARGILTSGGTLANLTALLAARKAIVENDVWMEGHKNRLALMVSREAHYCIDRAARIMGLGSEGIIKVPVREDFTIDTTRLEACYQEAKDKGFTVFALVGSAPSTATGIYDDLNALAEFCSQKGLWFHVDAAHGGAAVFSDKYRKTVFGIDKADSVVIDGHKMMMMSTITTALLFRDGGHSHATFSQEAEYLLEQSEEEDWYNLAKRTFECTKTMMSLQWFLMWKIYGEGIFGENVTTLYDLGALFAAMIQEAPKLELATQPHSNIVCFRYVAGDRTQEVQNEINKKIRQELLEEGTFYIVQTRIHGIQYLRCTLMNPFTTEADLRELLDQIRVKGDRLITA